ncbi:MAG: hypothetical protein AB1449_01295 [Chloroflexota bacterium]
MILAHLYPILYATYPVVALLAANLGEIPMSMAGRSLAVAGVAGLGLTLLLSVVVRSREKGSLLAVGFIMLFVSYGQVYDQIEGLSVGVVSIGRHRYLLAVWGLAAVGWVVWGMRRREVPRGLRLGLQAAGVALVVLPLLTIARYGLAGIGTVSRSEEHVLQVSTTALGPEEHPDIFYIILDGYGRSDVLRELYRVDNTGFLEFLESRGFYVADRSWSNYSQTLPSLASSLNMEYINALAARQASNSRDFRPLVELVDHSAVRRTFESLGYQFVAFETGYTLTEIKDAALYLAPRYDTFQERPSLFSALRLNEFEGMLLNSTLIRAAAEYYTREQENLRGLTDFLYQKHRIRVVFTLESLGEIAAMPGRYFVFAHVISPHPPFVFGGLGEEIPNFETYSMQDNGCCPRDIYLQRYADQVIYVSKLVEQTVEDILTNSDTLPIIIIQADHGPGAYINSQSPFDSNMRERLSILNAYLVPDSVKTLLYPSISPVNSFRALLAGYFGQSLDLLPDESYFSPGGHPYNLRRVTDSLRVLP